VVKLLPVPKATPPLEDANQLMVPALAEADNVKVPASQRLAPVTLLTVSVPLILAVTAVRVALVQVAVATSTKKSVVEDIEGVVKVVPVPIATPPVGLANQLMVPALAEANKFNVPASQRLAPETPVMEGVVFIVAVTDVRVELVQDAIATSAK
jgi:hypothetical protein